MRRSLQHRRQQPQALHQRKHCRRAVTIHSLLTNNAMENADKNNTGTAMRAIAAVRYALG
jgi:hypothetical protein